MSTNSSSNGPMSEDLVELSAKVVSPVPTVVW